MCGVVDFHTHILPHMDDGSQSLELSVKMLTLLGEQGADTVCLTPHYYLRREKIDSYLSRRAKAFSELEVALPGDCPNLILGTEVAYFSSISKFQRISELCLGKTNTLLLEMPPTEWTQLQVEDVISLVLDCGVRVVLAHPERYLFSKTNQAALERMVQLPIGLQVNAETLIHLTTRKKGLALLEMTDAPLLGTDSHNLKSRAPHLDRARKVIRSRLGEGFLARMDACAWTYLDMGRSRK